jgi:hypothetical protein
MGVESLCCQVTILDKRVEEGVKRGEEGVKRGEEIFLAIKKLCDN